MRAAPPPDARIEWRDGHAVGRFTAMAGPCEVLVETDDADEAAEALELVVAEARRIEHKFSRYRDDSVIQQLNTAAGVPQRVDPETAGLLDYADRLHAASDGRFDITTGALRRAWTFDGSDRVPTDDAIVRARSFVGWARVSWREGVLTLPPGMEIDLGGIGKEYAVDRAVHRVRAAIPAPALVNLGGDLAVTGPRRGGAAWQVGVDAPERTGGAIAWRVELVQGALATSGDARRFVRHAGRRLGHILDPRTGRPVEGGPASVTVLAATCLEAGTLATLALLQGAGAGAFLAAQGVTHRLG